MMINYNHYALRLSRILWLLVLVILLFWGRLWIFVDQPTQFLSHVSDGGIGLRVDSSATNSDVHVVGRSFFLQRDMGHISMLPRHIWARHGTWTLKSGWTWHNVVLDDWPLLPEKEDASLADANNLTRLWQASADWAKQIPGQDGTVLLQGHVQWFTPLHGCVRFWADEVVLDARTQCLRGHGRVVVHQGDQLLTGKVVHWCHDDQQVKIEGPIHMRTASKHCDPLW